MNSGMFDFIVICLRYAIGLPDFFRTVRSLSALFAKERRFFRRHKPIGWSGKPDTSPGTRLTSWPSDCARRCIRAAGVPVRMPLLGGCQLHAPAAIFSLAHSVSKRSDGKHAPMLASTLADKVSIVAPSSAASVSRNWRCLQANPPMMASGYSYGEDPIVVSCAHFATVPPEVTTRSCLSAPQRSKF